MGSWFLLAHGHRGSTGAMHGQGYPSLPGFVDKFHRLIKIILRVVYFAEKLIGRKIRLNDPNKIQVTKTYRILYIFVIRDCYFCHKM